MGSESIAHEAEGKKRQKSVLLVQTLSYCFFLLLLLFFYRSRFLHHFFLSITRFKFLVE